MALLTALGLALRLYRLGELPLIPDEAYYWLWSQHMDWAFLDNPSGVAVITWLSAAVGGQGEMGIRWLNAMLSTACIPLTYGLGRKMLTRQAGLLAAAAVALGAPYVLTGRLVYTDSLQLFLMLLSLHAFWAVLEAGDSPRVPVARWVALGLSCALLFNTKYSAYLFALALLVAVLLDHRWLLQRLGFWMAVSIAASGLLPVLLWNGAHGWMSFRWQLSHLGFSLSGPSGFAAWLVHALSYLTWPLVLLALLGLGRVRRASERLLSLVALFLLLPLIVSGTDSPRNLANGLVALLLLGGQTWPSLSNRRWHGLAQGLVVLALVSSAAYGAGTVLSLQGDSSWPTSSVAPVLRQEAVGLRALVEYLDKYSDPIFAVDYDLAARIWYYSERPTSTSWRQYQLWGIPDLRDVVLVSQEYLPAELITSRLGQAFQHVSGPELLRYEEGGLVREYRVWQGQGLQISQQEFLSAFDFLALFQAES